MDNIEYRTHHHIIFRIIDSIFIGVSLYLCMLFWNSRLFDSSIYKDVLFLSIFLFYIIADINYLHIEKKHSSSASLKKYLCVWIWIVFFLLAFAFSLKVTSVYSRVIILTWFLSTPLVMFLGHMAIKNLIKLYHSRQYKKTIKVAIAGTNHTAVDFAKNLIKNAEEGIEFIGFYDYSQPSSPINIDGQEFLPSTHIDEMVDQAKKSEIDIVYLSLSPALEEKTHQLIFALSDTTASVYILFPESYNNMLYARTIFTEKFMMLSVYDTPFNETNNFIKRMEDIVLSTLILIIVAIPMILIALCIKLSSLKDPVLFKQLRYGINGKMVYVWKFRTMTVCENGSTIKQATKNDQRVTALGYYYLER